MGVFRKENGSIIRKSGIAVVDLILNKLSSHAVANSAVTAKFEEVDDSIIKINNDLSEKSSYCTTANTEISFILDSTSHAYAVTHTGYYYINMYSGSTTAHDIAVELSGVEIASQFVVTQYQRLNLYIPLRAGTALKFDGAIGDGILIAYATGVV